MGRKERTQGASKSLQRNHCYFLVFITQMLTPSYSVCLFDSWCLRYSAFLPKCHLPIVSSEMTAMLRFWGWVFCFVGFISASLLQDNSALAESTQKRLLFQVLLSSGKLEKLFTSIPWSQPTKLNFLPKE